MGTICDNCLKVLKKKKMNHCKHVFCDMKCRDEFRNKNIPIYKCDNCNADVKKQKNGKNIFCNQNCKTKFTLKKYSILYETFTVNINETAYLFGLILGDGHLKKTGQNTTRISIAFNAADDVGLMIAKTVMSKLQINYFIEPLLHNNCLTLGFILPDDILIKYNMLFHGNKYTAQPNCRYDLISNVNFALGLLNSDGCLYTYLKKPKRVISFSNVVKSIIDDFLECLKLNNIHNCLYKSQPKNQKWKLSYRVHISRKSEIAKIRSCPYSKWYIPSTN